MPRIYPLLLCLLSLSCIENGKAQVSADLYEWTPHDEARLKYQKTTITDRPGEWKMLELTFKTLDYDPFVDLRFVVIGDGFANFDDFSFKKL